MIEAKNVSQILSKHMNITGAFEEIIDLDKSKGSWFVDKRNRHKYLDFGSMFACMAVGYNHPELLKAKEQLGGVALTKPSSSDFYTVEMAEFVDTFSRIGIPDHLPHLFIIEGGALAVENALKVAFDWKIRKNFHKGETSEVGSKVIHFKQAFHGRSGYTLSLTNTDDPNKTKYFPKFDWPRIINPKVEYPLNEENLEKVTMLERQATQQIKEVITKDGRDIAALIIEPIQGEGGDNHFRKEFIQQLRGICSDNEIILIFDEVQTGVGLTGRFWAYEHYDVEPDIICIGKKAQVGGILAGRRIDEIENNVFQESSRLNSTWGGNLVDMVRFTHILRIIAEENLVENARVQGEHLLSGLRRLSEEFPHLVLNARGKGLMCAIDLPTKEKRNLFINKMMSEKVMIMGCGEKSIRFRPHLIVTEEEIKYGIEIVKKVLKSM